jgi:hypothetical protein
VRRGEYAYSFQLLVTFAAERLRKLPSQEVDDTGYAQT